MLKLSKALVFLLFISSLCGCGSQGHKEEEPQVIREEPTAPQVVVVIIKDDGDGKERVVVKEDTDGQSSEGNCMQFIIPQFPNPPSFPKIPTDLRDDPETLINILIEYVSVLRKHDSNKDQVLAEAYNNYVEDCQ